MRFQDELPSAVSIELETAPEVDHAVVGSPEAARDGGRALAQRSGGAAGLWWTSDEESRVGLAFTKAIVEQHGGYLEVVSEPGGGTYARLRLPLRD